MPKVNVVVCNGRGFVLSRNNRAGQGPEALTEIGVFEQGTESLSEVGRGIGGWDDAALGEEFITACGGGGDARKAAGHRFEESVRHTLSVRREAENIGPVEKPEDVVSWSPKPNPVVEAVLADKVMETLDVP